MGSTARQGSTPDPRSTRRPGDDAQLLQPRSPRVAALRALTTRSGRTAERRFLVEGPQLVREALAAGVVRELLCTPDAALRHPDLLAAWPSAVTLISDRTTAAYAAYCSSSVGARSAFKNRNSVR